jgi:hypothetical protein
MQLSDLDDQYAAGMTEEEFLEASKEISGLTVDQLRVVLERESDE